MMSLNHVDEEETRRIAKDRAIQRVALDLQQPDQLERVEQIRARHYSKKISLETQLKNLVTSQLKEAREGMEKLSQAMKVLAKIKKNAESVRGLSSETQQLIPHYDTVQQVADIQALLEDDINLLEVHREMRQLEKARDFVLKQAEKFPEQQRQLKELFYNVNLLSDEFETHIWELVADHIRLAMTRPAVLVKVMQIINREDLAFQKMEEAAKKDNVLEPEEVSRPISPRTGGQNYFDICRDKLWTTLRTRVFDHFADARLDTGGYDVPKFIERTRDIVEDLEKVFDYVAPCFPPKYEILNLYVKVYHESLYEILSEISKAAGRGDADPKSTLLLVKWIKTFYEPQLVRVGVDEVKPDLMDALDMLIDDFRGRIYRLMEGWASRIIDTDRDHDLEDIDGYWYTLAPVTLFTFIHQQLDVAHATTNSMMVFVTADECRKILIVFQNRCLENLNLYASWVGTERKIDVEYIIAQVNNFNKCYDYVLEVEDKVSMLDEDLKLNLGIDKVLDGFRNLIQLSRQLLQVYMFYDVQDEFKKFFSREWSEGFDAMNSILATLQDYYDNVLKGRLVESYFKKFVVENAEELIERYLMQLITVRHVIKKEWISKILDEVDAAKQFFLTWEVREKVLNAKFQPVFDIIDLLSVPLDNVSKLVRVMGTLLDTYRDITEKIVETIYMMRHDSDKKLIRTLLDEFRRMQDKQIPLPDGELPKETMFTRMKPFIK